MKTVKIYGVTYTGKRVGYGVFEFTRKSKYLNENRFSNDSFAYDYMDEPGEKVAHSASKRAIRFMFTDLK